MKVSKQSLGRGWLVEASRLIGIAPVFVMSTAAVMLFFAVHALQDFVKISRDETREADLPQFVLKREPVGKLMYEDYARVLGRLSPSVNVQAQANGISISIADAERYAEFMYVLNSVQGLAKDVVWQAEELCLANCGGKASHALVKGNVEKVLVTLKGN